MQSVRFSYTVRASSARAGWKPALPGGDGDNLKIWEMTAMRCPRCKHTLRTIEYEGISIETCSKCKGILKNIRDDDAKHAKMLQDHINELGKKNKFK